MRTLRIELQLAADALVGSGEGFGALIDSDVVFDDLGVPYIPAKRIKGCLLQSAREVEAMLKSAGIDREMNIKTAFGEQGSSVSAPLFFNNLFIDNYESNYQWLKYLADSYAGVVSAETILSAFTNQRQQTAIDQENGVALDHSLRTIRVIQSGHTFYGDLDCPEENAFDELLALACANLKRIGTKRTRGFGEVRCRLWENNTDLTDKYVKGLA